MPAKANVIGPHGQRRHLHCQRLGHASASMPSTAASRCLACRATCSGKTVNGGVNVELAGEHWEGAGLDARTTNGGVSIKVPDGYSCQLAVTTVNGGVRSDFPLTVQGRLDKNIDVTLGKGGAPVRVATTNGGVHLKH